MLSLSGTEQDNEPSDSTRMLKRVRLDRKLTGFEYWRQTLQAARFILAPMVDQSELAWRMMGRRHGVQLAFTPMINTRIFEVNKECRKANWEVWPKDRPLIGQVCGDDVDIILRVCKSLQGDCDGIDLNLGCPQNIAKKGHYGAYLQDEWPLIQQIVKTLHEELEIPVSVKIRIFEDVKKTVEYAKMLEQAGAQMITVHGRTRDQKGPQAGLADWSQIKAVVEAVKVPVIANGNILCLGDIHECLKFTGAVGVMSAEGHLYNPCIFEGIEPRIADMVEEYWGFTKQFPTQFSFIRGHLFKLYRPCLSVEKFIPYRQPLGVAQTLVHLEELCNEMNSLLRQDEEESQASDFKHWLCCPYIRHQLDKQNIKLEVVPKEQTVK